MIAQLQAAGLRSGVWTRMTPSAGRMHTPSEPWWCRLRTGSRQSTPSRQASRIATPPHPGCPPLTMAALAPHPCPQGP